METSLPGIFACGNVVQVHDLVDWVTEEARKAGKAAARFVLGQIKAQEPDLVTKAGTGVRYVVPQRVRLENVDKDLELMFRVTDPFQEKVLVARHGDTVLKKAKKAHLAPGEMENLKIPVDKLQGLTGELTLCLEEVAQ
jgi:hypothetical protein